MKRLFSSVALGLSVIAGLNAADPAWAAAASIASGKFIPTYAPALR